MAKNLSYGHHWSLDFVIIVDDDNDDDDNENDDDDDDAYYYEDFDILLRSFLINLPTCYCHCNCPYFHHCQPNIISYFIMIYMISISI